MTGQSQDQEKKGLSSVRRSALTISVGVAIAMSSGLGVASAAPRKQTVLNSTGVPIQIYQFIYSNNEKNLTDSSTPYGTVLQNGGTATFQFTKSGHVTINFQNPPNAGPNNPVKSTWAVNFNSDSDTPACQASDPAYCSNRIITGAAADDWFWQVVLTSSKPAPAPPPPAPTRPPVPVVPGVPPTQFVPPQH
ncbi:MAG: hypothetical protein WA622_02875 [Mycobacterium sp.]|uniref:hypothetical protein n=1 Tax=Mycobacterium sp. TaxID=1785 RepID=UPI003BB7FB69